MEFLWPLYMAPIFKIGMKVDQVAHMGGSWNTCNLKKKIIILCNNCHNDVNSILCVHFKRFIGEVENIYSILPISIHVELITKALATIVDHHQESTRYLILTQFNHSQHRHIAWANYGTSLPNVLETTCSSRNVQQMQREHGERDDH